MPLEAVHARSRPAAVLAARPSRNAKNHGGKLRSVLLFLSGASAMAVMGIGLLEWRAPGGLKAVVAELNASGASSVEDAGLAKDAGTGGDAGKDRSSEPEVALAGSYDNASWKVRFYLQEQHPLEIWYKQPSDPDFISTGRNRYARKNGTGEFLANTDVTLPGLRGRIPFQVKYRDVSGAIKGPFTVMFDTRAEAVTEAKHALETDPLWITFTNYTEKEMCHFFRIKNVAYGLESARYSIDRETYDRSLPLSSSAKDYFELPARSSYLAVEVTYLDGGKTRKRFPVQHRE